MSQEKPGWLRALLQMLDQRLRGLSRTLRRVVRILRLGRFIMILLVLALVAAAVLPFLWTETVPYAIAVVAVGAIVGLMVPLVLISLPLQAKSIVRLIDKGYPDNAKEFAIRMAARKLHEESIETEELLLDTAWNESKKIARKYRKRAERLRAELDAEEAAEEAAKRPAPKRPSKAGSKTGSKAASKGNKGKKE